MIAAVLVLVIINIIVFAYFANRLRSDVNALRNSISALSAKLDECVTHEEITVLRSEVDAIKERISSNGAVRDFRH
jgi:hypothetical protein